MRPAADKEGVRGWKLTSRDRDQRNPFQMTTNPWRRAERPLTISHRGHSIAYPENTRIAYEKAIELGCEMIECDVNITSDGVLVMMHDWKLDRTTNGSGRVSDCTWADIQRLD